MQNSENGITILKFELAENLATAVAKGTATDSVLSKNVRRYAYIVKKLFLLTTKRLYLIKVIIIFQNITTNSTCMPFLIDGSYWY